MAPRSTAPAAQTPGESTRVEMVHRHAFVQGMMARSVLSEPEAKTLWSRLCGKPSDASYTEVISQANEGMAFAGLQLKTIKYPLNDTLYLGLINKEADEPAKLGSKYTLQQRGYFMAVIEYLAHCEPGPLASASEVQLMHLDVPAPQAAGAAEAGGSPTAGPSQGPSQTPGGGGGATQGAAQRQGAATAAAAPKQLTKVQKVETLHSLLNDNWLAQPPNSPNYYCIGVRTLLELGDFLIGLDNLPEETRTMYDNLL